MPYVERDGSNNIKGLYANEQPGYAEEYLPDDDPEVLAFVAKIDVLNQQRQDAGG